MGPSFSPSSTTSLEDSLQNRASGIAPGARPSKDTFASEAAAEGLLFVDLPPPRPTARGRLAFFIDGAIERALDARGAPAPRVASTADFDCSLGDQIERAQVSGARGVALWFGPLEPIAKARVLDCEDSAAIRRLNVAAREQPVRLGFDSTNFSLYAFREPEPLLVALEDPSRDRDEPSSEESISSGDHDDPLEAQSSEAGAPDSDPEMHGPSPVASSADTEDCEPIATFSGTDGERPAGNAAPELPSEPARNAEEDAEPTEDPPLADPGPSLAESARAMADELNGDEEASWLREALIELSTPKPRPAIEHVPDVAQASGDERGRVLEAGAARALADLAAELEDATPTPSSDPAPFHIAFAEATAEPPKPAVDPELQKRLEAAARELDFANGPKPLAMVERLFTSAYVPLRAALDRGAHFPALAETADEWARSFEKSYSEAFDALKMRTKRPKMIPDLPDIALRIGRLHGARSVQLLLVDGMRYDLGENIHEKVRALSGQRAACAERLVVWSALPTRTTAQIELLGRGAAALREYTGEVSEDLVVARGRKASMIRRLKTGHRELLKLDVVEARLGEPGSVTAERLGSVAEEAAQRIAAYFEDLQPRTLVLVFGDHGFRLVRSGEGLVTARQGGASPEEVLVPADAWLVGAVH